MQYHVIFADGESLEKTLQKVEEQTKGYIERGWTPLGNVSITVNDFDWFFASQAVIKEE